MNYVEHNGLLECISFEDCKNSSLGVFTVQFDGMRLCTAQCSPGYVNVTRECKEDCPDLYDKKDGQCTPSSTIKDKDGYLEDGKLVTDCSNRTYDAETRECLSSAEKCTFYRRVEQNIECVRACDPAQFVYNRECVTDCPTTIRYKDGQNCVETCASGVRDGKTCIFGVTGCAHYREVDGALSCVSECAAEELELGQRCVSACPAGMFVDVAGKKCVEKCAESGEQRFRQAGDERRCLEPGTECAFSETFSDVNGT